MFRIMKYLSKAEIGQMLIALVTIVGQVYFDLKLPDYMSDITTLVETPGSHMKDIWIAGGKMLLISLGSAACAIITGYIAARVAASFTQRLRSLEFRKVESFGPAEMSKFSTASLITRSTNDVTQVQVFITMGLQLIVKSPIMAVWAVCKIAGEVCGEVIAPNAEGVDHEGPRVENDHVVYAEGTARNIDTAPCGCA